ncbi:MAG: carbohydrate kinase [Spirochaetales bacterium]|nr:carbohydrate kinase [Spirochaetales bacterium]
MKSVLAICLSPTFQKIMVFRNFHVDEVNRCVRLLEIASGKGINVTRVINDLGRPATSMAQLGGTRTEEFLSLCRRDNIDIRFVRVPADIRTCTTIINEEDHTSTELVEEAREVSPEASEEFFRLFMRELPAFDAVVISGTKAGGFSADLYPRMVRECRRSGKLSVLDIKGDDLIASLKEGPSIIKPNLSEFCATFMKDVVLYENSDDGSTYDRVRELARSFYEKYGTRTVITRGKYDTWVYNGSALAVIPSIETDLPIVNTIGCGDTLTGAMTHSLLEGNELEKAVEFGMRCALRKATHIEQGI